MKGVRGPLGLVGLVGLMLGAAGCSGVLPLGPAPAPTPSSHRLAAAIVLEPGLAQPGVSASDCPAGSVVLTGPGTPIAAPVGDPAAGTHAGLCFHVLGQPVTFTTAGVAVVEQQAGARPVRHPALWMVNVTVTAAEARELTTVTTKVAGTQDQLAIIVGGQTWGLPLTRAPLSHGQFAIAAHSKSQALQWQRALLPSA
jgi:hypothetical protein